MVKKNKHSNKNSKNTNQSIIPTRQVKGLNELLENSNIIEKIENNNKLLMDQTEIEDGFNNEIDKSEIKRKNLLTIYSKSKLSLENFLKEFPIYKGVKVNGKETIAECTVILNNKMEGLKELTTRILIAGDANSGKTTFINRLSGKTLIKPSSCPCNAIRMEIKSSIFNEGVEEVHQFADLKQYDPKNKETYTQLSLDEFNKMLRKINENDPERNFTIYYKESDNTLFYYNNIYISMVEFEGLNVNSFDTKNLTNSQYQFDCIIFLIKATDGFTDSVQNFLNTAVNQNNFKYFFFVVNKNDEVEEEEVLDNRIKIMDNIEKNYNDTYKNKDKLVHFIVAKKEKEDDEMKAAFEKLIQCLKEYLFIEKNKSKYSTYIGYLDNVLKNTMKTCEEEITKKEMEIINNNNCITDIETKFYEKRDNVEEKVKSLIKEINNHYETERNNINEKIKDREEKNKEKKEEESKNKSKSKSKGKGKGKGKTKQIKKIKSIFNLSSITEMNKYIMNKYEEAYSILNEKPHNEKTTDEELNNFIKFFNYRKTKSETNIYNKILEIINEKNEINKIITDTMITNYLSINDFYIISEFITRMMNEVKVKLDEKKDYYKLKFEKFYDNDLLNKINQDPLNNEENILSQKYRDDVLNKIGSSMNDELNKYLIEMKKEFNDWLLTETKDELEKNEDFCKLVENLTTIKALKNIKKEQKIQDENSEEEKSNLVDKEFIQVEENVFKKIISSIVNYIIVNFVYPGEKNSRINKYIYGLVKNYLKDGDKYTKIIDTLFKEIKKGVNNYFKYKYIKEFATISYIANMKYVKEKYNQCTEYKNELKEIRENFNEINKTLSKENEKSREEIEKLNTKIIEFKKLKSELLKIK